MWRSWGLPRWYRRRVTLPNGPHAPLVALGWHRKDSRPIWVPFQAPLPYTTVRAAGGRHAVWGVWERLCGASGPMNAPKCMGCLPYHPRTAPGSTNNTGGSAVAIAHRHSAARQRAGLAAGMRPGGVRGRLWVILSKVRHKRRPYSRSTYLYCPRNAPGWGLHVAISLMTPNRWFDLLKLRNRSNRHRHTCFFI